MSNTEIPIACSLDATSYQQRVGWIRELMGRALREYRREGPRLHLVFDAVARADVREFARQEKACCAFLDFALSEAGNAITLTITVPPHAIDAAGELLAPFIPSSVIKACACESAESPRAAGALTGISIVCGAGALLCAAGCLLPLALAAAGVGGAWLGNIDALAAWRFPILGVAMLSLGLAWVLHYRSGVMAVGRSRGLQLAALLVLVAAAWGWIEPALIKVFS